MKTIIKNATECIYANLTGIETEGRTLKDCKAALTRLMAELEPVKYLDRKEEKSLPLDTLRAALDAKTLKIFIQTATAAAEELAALKARKQVPQAVVFTESTGPFCGNCENENLHMDSDTCAACAESCEKAVGFKPKQFPELSATESLPPVLAAIADNMDKVEAASAEGALAIFTPQSVEEVMYPETLEGYKIEIIMHMERAASSALKVGCLLVQARKLCSNQEEFLKWAAEQVQIGKSQAYRLISIHKEFGEDARFDGVAMRVLDMLSGQPEAVKIKAVELAAAGKLDSKAAEVIIGKVIDITPPLKLSGNMVVIPITQREQVNMNGPEDADFSAAPEKDCPFDTGVEPYKVSTVPQEFAQREPKSLDELLHTVEQLQARITELSKPLPALVQFSNERMHTRLGLDLVEAKDSKAIRAAYRVLAAIWSKDSAPESFKLLTEAKDELLS